MLIKPTIWLKKITAVFLLLVLFAVTLIQVTHTHSPASNKQEKSFTNKSRLPGYYKISAENKCFICEYQLTRDADASYVVVNLIFPVEYHNAANAYYSFTLQHSAFYFETRGPPSAC